MLHVLKKLIYTGTVTEAYDAAAPAPRARGRLQLGEACRQCRVCAAVCPTQALSFDSGRLTVNHKACLFCGRCVERCERQQLVHTADYQLAELSDIWQEPATGSQLAEKIRRLLGRSLHIRHVDAGSCNACDFEMNALSNPFYDLQQYGLDFVASPRHADMLLVTGVVTRNLRQALQMTYEAVPQPKLVMAVGACAASGQVFGASYAQCGAVDTIVPVDIYVPGCPPSPQAILYGLLLALDRLPQARK